MQFGFHDYHPPAEDLLGEVLNGLAGQPKRLSPKFFYDRRGSELFDEITRLPEYYPTRTELAIMRDHVAEMAARIGRSAEDGQAFLRHYTRTLAAQGKYSLTVWPA